MECGKTRNGFFNDNTSNKDIKLNKDYTKNPIKTTCIEIQTQHWGGNRQLLMEGIAVEYIANSVYPCINETRLEFNEYISD